MKVVEQHSDYRDHPQWNVLAGKETYSVRAPDSEDAAYIVAGHLGFTPSQVELMRRDKGYSTGLRLPDGRDVGSLPWDDPERLGT